MITGLGATLPGLPVGRAEELAPRPGGVTGTIVGAVVGTVVGTAAGG
jgi:hypothetical protein